MSGNAGVAWRIRGRDVKWVIILAVYFGIGSFFMVFTMARLEISLAVRESVGHKSPWWFAMLAWVMVLGTSILLWPVLLKGWFAKAHCVRGVFPGGDGYRVLQKRLRLIDALRREMDGYLIETMGGHAAAQRAQTCQSTEMKMEKVHLFCCPFCGSKQAVRISYGYPFPETMQLVAAGKIALGGCCISKNSPNRECPDCKKSWVGQDGEEVFEEEFPVRVSTSKRSH